MKSEFILALNEVVEEKQLPLDTIVKALESAMVSAYRKNVMASNAQYVDAKLEQETGKFIIYAEKEVVDSIVDDRTEVLLEEARKVRPECEIGDMVVVESTPEDFGRVAAQTARQVIQQRFRDAEKNDQVEHYNKQVGEIVSGIVQSFTSDGLTIGLEKKAEGTLPKKEQIKGERFRMHDRVRALVVEVKDGTRAPQILLSRTHRDFLRRLLENEVPEIYHGIVELRGITREPGERAKIAVSATQAGIDPVGACVGQRGVRIQAIVKELHDEKIDVIEWNPDPVIFISKALSPAKVSGVYLGEGINATVIVAEDQLSLAIGKEGQNARLAARLTGWRIDIKSISEAASELIHKYENGEGVDLYHEDTEETETISCKDLFKDEEETIEAVRGILAKKIDNRPVTNDENETLFRFVDRVEKRQVARAHVVSVVEKIRQFKAKELTSDEVKAVSVKSCGLPKHVGDILSESGYTSVGEVYDVMKRDPEEMYKIRGITPKVISEIAKLVSHISALESEEAAAAEAEAAVEIEPEPEIVVEPEPVEIPAVSETVYEEQPAAEPEQPAVEEVPETEMTMDELFNSVQIEPTFSDDDELPMDTGYDKPARKSKKKKKGVEIEYDPDSDSTTVRRKHKRGDDDWGW